MEDLENRSFKTSGFCKGAGIVLKPVGSERSGASKVELRDRNVRKV